MAQKPSYHLPLGVWSEVLSSVESELWSELGQERLCGQVVEVNYGVMGLQFTLYNDFSRDIAESHFTCAQLPSMWTLT